MDDLLKNTFNNEADIYDDTTQYLLLNYNGILQEVLSQIKFKKEDCFTILDVGCGTGNLINLININFPNAIIYGIDFSNDMLEKARKKCIENKNLKFITLDMFKLGETSLPYFDVIISSYVFHNLRNVEQHKKIFQIINEHLVYNGEFILADLIDLQNVHLHKEYISKLVDSMRRSQVDEEQIIKWLGILECEDTPLPPETTKNLLLNSNFTNVRIKEFQDCGCAVFVSENHNLITLKLELLFNGVQKNSVVNAIYEKQNPNNIWKTGNNGIFLSLDKKYQVLVGINHEANLLSPYKFLQQGGSFKLIKNDNILDVDINVMNIPDWAYQQVGDENFSDYFVYEGEGYLHLAYKGCSFDVDQKCKFCSTSRRENSSDHSAAEICRMIRAVIKDIPDDVHFCLGGGTYLPFSENVEYFKEIIACIRDCGKTNPIWVECIPPSLDEIDKLIEVGATAFGFNLEIWDDDRRKSICPGKSQISKDYYLTACKHVLKKCGSNKVGSCLIVGIDDINNIKQSIDELSNLGIMPCILPYKDFGTGLEIEGYSTFAFYNLSKYAANVCKTKGVKVIDNQGCLKCPCCTIMHDLQK